MNDLLKWETNMHFWTKGVPLYLQGFFYITLIVHNFTLSGELKGCTGEGTLDEAGGRKDHSLHHAEYNEVVGGSSACGGASGKAMSRKMVKSPRPISH